MISSLNQTTVTLNGSNVLRPQYSVPSRRSSVLPPLPAVNARRSSSVLSFSKPLFVSKIESFGSLSTSSSACGFDGDGDRKQQQSQLVVCKAYEADKSSPIEDSEAPSEGARKLKIGVYFATWWALNVVFNKYNKKVAIAHTIGHVAATVSMLKVAVSFTHIIKSVKPAFSVLVSRFILGETFPLSVYLSLVPIIGGCALAAVTELNFNMIGFMGAMI